MKLQTFFVVSCLLRGKYKPSDCRKWQRIGKRHQSRNWFSTWDQQFERSLNTKYRGSSGCLTALMVVMHTTLHFDLERVC